MAAPPARDAIMITEHPRQRPSVPVFALCQTGSSVAFARNACMSAVRPPSAMCRFPNRSDMAGRFTPIPLGHAAHVPRPPCFAGSPVARDARMEVASAMPVANGLPAMPAKHPHRRERSVRPVAYPCPVPHMGMSHAWGYVPCPGSCSLRRVSESVHAPPSSYALCLSHENITAGGCPCRLARHATGAACVAVHPIIIGL